MSLHTLAQHLQTAGRGDDKVLVHMTPGEVQGLQALAMAQGGSLTINPETGLPEAGILRSLLPMIAGFALGPAGFGLMSSLQAGLTVGALTGVATGSLKQGIMAGLGAYGGSGMGEGLMAQGAKAMPPAAVSPTQYPSTLGGSNMFAKVGAENIAGATPFTATPGGMTGFTSTVPPVAPVTPAPFPTYAQTQSNILNTIAPNATAQPVVPVDRFVGSANTLPQTQIVPQTRITTPDTMVRTGDVIKMPQPAPKVADRITGFEQGQYPAKGQYASANYGLAGPRPPVRVDPSTIDMNKVGSYYVNPDGTISNVIPRAGAVTQPSTYVPSTATTSQPFAEDVMTGRGMIYQGAPMPTEVVPSPLQARMSQLGAGARESFSGIEGLKGLYGAMPTGSVIASGLSLAEGLKPEPIGDQRQRSLVRPYTFDYGATGVASQPYTGSAERMYFNPVFTARTPYEAPGPEYAAKGGLMGLAAGGGPVEKMSDMNAIGSNTGYPMADINTPSYSNPMVQRPEATNVIAPSADTGVGTYTGQMMMAGGGLSTLGSYSDGGRLLRGPGDGVSDSIPASIGNRQPARLADGEFVVPARIVSEIGNGSTEAGARKLYAMMDRVQRARRKTTGKGKVAVNTKAEELLPA